MTLRAGFGWELGAFESWDAIGFEDSLKAIAERGLAVPDWIETFKTQSDGTFYRNVDGVRQCRDPRSGHEAVGGQEGRLSTGCLAQPRSGPIGNDHSGLGRRHLNVAFHTKMNSIGAEVLEGVNKAIDLAESDDAWRGVVISSEGAQFSAGANMGWSSVAVEQEYDELNYAIRMFQNTVMRLRYSGIPVIVALTSSPSVAGVKCAFTPTRSSPTRRPTWALWSLASGSSRGRRHEEFVLRLNDEMHDEDMRINRLRDRFLTIGQAKVATSGTRPLNWATCGKALTKSSTAAIDSPGPRRRN